MTSNSSGQALPIGSHLQEFEIESVLGRGGFGITYLARDTSLNRRVVIKENLPSAFAFRDTSSGIVRPQAEVGEDAENFAWSLQNFLREADTLAALNHVGIVKVLRKFEANGTAYFVMPYEAGVPLDQEISDRKNHRSYFEENEVIGLLEHLLDVLEYLHERGIYHRDIKPGNILITDEGVPVLIDFGSARQRLSERTMTVVESAGYTPIEQLNSRGNVGPWSDLYSLGATLAKAIIFETPPKVVDRMMNDLWVPLSSRPELRARYTENFLAGIDRALVIDSKGRWQSANQWIKAAIHVDQKEVEDMPSILRRPKLRGSNRLSDFEIKQQQKLRDLRDSLLDAMAGVARDNLRSDADTSAFGMHQADADGDAYDRDFALNLLSQEQNALHEIDEALKRIDNGTYGICEMSQKKILRARLEAIPFTRYTVECQARIEKENGLRVERSLPDRGNVSGFMDERRGRFNKTIPGVDKNGESIDVPSFIRNKNSLESVKWYRKAAERGDANAQYALGYMYANGKGVTKDEVEAVNWYRKAAEQGDANAQYNLGYMYSNGKGVTKDDVEAVKWYRKAADRIGGHALAQYALGYMYENVLGVKRNDIEAVKWYRRATAHGNENAKLALLRLGVGLNE